MKIDVLIILKIIQIAARSLLCLDVSLTILSKYTHMLVMLLYHCRIYNTDSWLSSYPAVSAREAPQNWLRYEQTFVKMWWMSGTRPPVYLKVNFAAIHSCMSSAYALFCAAALRFAGAKTFFSAILIFSLCKLQVALSAVSLDCGCISMYSSTMQYLEASTNARFIISGPW